MLYAHYESSVGDKKATQEYGTRYNKVSTQHTDTGTSVQQMHERASTDAQTGVHRCTNGHLRQTGTGVRQILKGASDRTSTGDAMIIGSCQKCWRIPANATYIIPANDTCK